jgi:TrmH family RNA methyltransferase
LITSLRNATVQRARKLTKRGVRDDRRTFVIEGAKGVGEALTADAPVTCILLDPTAGAHSSIRVGAKAQRIPVLDVSPTIMAAVSQATTPPGIVAICDFVDVDARLLIDRSAGLVVVLGGVRDPGNAGTIIRSSAAVGASAIYLSPGTVDVYNPKVVRSTAGALFGVPFARDVELPWLLDELGKRGFQRLGADARGQTTYDQVDMTGPTALILGGEAGGLPADVLAGIDATVAIPMHPGVESLNVGMATAILLFEAARQRRHSGGAPKDPSSRGGEAST